MPYYDDLVLLSIDPGTQYLGYSVIAINRSKRTRELIGYGTLYGRGKGMEIATGLINSINDLIKQYDVTTLASENYQFLKGRTSGMFVVPMLLGILKYNWFLKTSQETIMVWSQSWKSYLIGRPGGDKLAVVEGMMHILPEDTIEELHATFSEIRGSKKSDSGEQDCIDAIGIGLYVSHEILNYETIKEHMIL